MKSLMPFLSSYQVVQSDMDVLIGCIVVVVHRNQPVALFMPNGQKISFGVIQVENTDRLSSKDLSIINRVLADFDLNALIIIDYKGNISGVISPINLKDLEKTIFSERVVGGRQFDIRRPEDSVFLPDVKTARIWTCKKHPDAPPFFLHQVGQPPFCPLCDGERPLSSKRLFNTKKFWFFWK